MKYVNLFVEFRGKNSRVDTFDYVTEISNLETKNIDVLLLLLFSK